MLSAINSCQQPITVDENENQPRESQFGTHTNFTVQMKIPDIFFQISCHQLPTAVNSKRK